MVVEFYLNRRTERKLISNMETKISFRHQQLNYLSFIVISAEIQQTVPKWMIITLMPRVLFLSYKSLSVHKEVMRETMSTIAIASGRVPAKSMGAVPHGSA